MSGKQWMDARRELAEQEEQRRPVHPLRAVREMITAIETCVFTVDDIERARVLVKAQCEAARTLCDAMAVMHRPAQPPVKGIVHPTFDGPVRVGRQQDPPPIHVDESGDITRPRMEE